MIVDDSYISIRVHAYVKKNVDYTFEGCNFCLNYDVSLRQLLPIYTVLGG